MKRRELILAGAAAVTLLTPRALRADGRAAVPGRTHSLPLVHITDLYHPPQDPDDHIDLATIAALSEYDLKAVILDVTEKFLLPAPAGFDIRRDPGFLPIAQLGYLLGRTIPTASGPTLPLARPDDDVRDRPRQHQAGVNLLLDCLDASSAPVVISLVGSARVLTAAYNRDPVLVRRKVRSVLLNAGSTGGPKREWNVGLDTEAYKGLWRSGLPLQWYPCAVETGAFNPDHERGTYWKTTHKELFRALSLPLRAWFSFALTGDTRGDFIAALGEAPSAAGWEKILAQSRNMWATASLVMTAGRVLARTAEGWRFVPSDTAAPGAVWPWRLDPIHAEIGPDATVQWRPAEGTGNALLFGRERRPGYGDAMAEALADLLGTL
jgi:pyrimidine-specific ribonucleoside hydrolase